jgi:HSP20 family protein
MAKKKIALARVRPSVFDNMEMLSKNFLGMRMSPWASIWKRPYEITIFPSLDVFEKNGHLTIRADLPRMSKEDIDIDITDHTLTISGEREKEEKIEDKDYHHIERSYGTFSRSIKLPMDVEPNKINAKFKDGTLEIRIPKSKTAKTSGQRITIQ